MLLKHFSRIADHRERGKVDHELRDVFMSALAMFCFQDPSLLQFQKRAKAPVLAENLRNMWGIESIPSDSQMRVVMDEIDSREFDPLFAAFFRLLQRGKHLEPYRVWGEYYLCVVDGSEYFNSDYIACPSCLRHKVKKKRGESFSSPIISSRRLSFIRSCVRSSRCVPKGCKTAMGPQSRTAKRMPPSALSGRSEESIPGFPLSSSPTHSTAPSPWWRPSLLTRCAMSWR